MVVLRRGRIPSTLMKKFERFGLNQTRTSKGNSMGNKARMLLVLGESISLCLITFVANQTQVVPTIM